MLIMQTQYYLTVKSRNHKQKLSNAAIFLVFKWLAVPVVTYGHEPWAMTERALPQVQTAKMGFLRRVHGATLRKKAQL